PQSGSRTYTREFGNIADGKFHEYILWIDWKTGNGGTGKLYKDGQLLHTYTGMNCSKPDARTHFKNGWYRSAMKSQMYGTFANVAITNGYPQYPKSLLQSAVEDAVTAP